MTKNYFKTIRTSYITSSFITCLMSNVLVFGQPILQMAHRVEQIKGPEKTANLSSKVSSITTVNSVEDMEDEPETLVYDKADIVLTNKVKETASKSGNSSKPSKLYHPVSVKPSNRFIAYETHGVIGVFSSSEKENRNDNYFTVVLPETLNLVDYDVTMSYDLYGLTHANQTTKSINNFESYGGKTLKFNKEWTSVEESLNPNSLKAGENIIFFTRRQQLAYQYEIKNLSFQIIKKKAKSITLSQQNLTNYNGKVLLSGYAEDGIVAVEVLGMKKTVNASNFEFVINNVAETEKSIRMSYFMTSGKEITRDYPIVYRANDFDEIFQDSEELNEANFKVLDSRQMSFEAVTVSLDTLYQQDRDLEIQLEGLNFKDFKLLNSELTNITAGQYLSYRTKTKGVFDSLNMKIHLKYDASKIPDGYGLKDVRMFSYDKGRREWMQLSVDSLDVENNTVISNYNGDTDYINGVIKVPEMPETANFTPTTITDMEYANPAAGVVSVAPPTPSHTGAATTSFPIKLPNGRNGMMPSLNVSYNSGGGNGWMGVGWNLQLPAITLDTKWGAPRFDTSKESEIYLLNGEPLVAKNGSNYVNPHRSGNYNRTGSRPFYLRKEGAYLKVTRNGSIGNTNSVSSYSWTVYDKSGNLSVYGSDNNSRIYSSDGKNITHWALKQTMDTHGNMVEYTYDKITTSVNGISVQSFYPKTITYTRNLAFNSNYYQVDFIRNTYSVGTSGSITREDVMLNARTGAMMYTKDLLTEVKVSFKNGTLKPVRTYRFDYGTSAFNKKQLNKISEYDSNGDLFYSNTMEYFDEVGNGQVIGTTPKSWNGSSANVNTPATLNAIGNANGTALGTSRTDGFSVGLRAGGGLGLNILSVAATAAGSYNYSQNKEETQISFVDINGDGLPDKVYKPTTGNNLKYLPNLGLINNNGAFGNAITIQDLSSLDKTKSRTNGFGFDFNGGYIGLGASISKTRTDTENYFTDFNGDGLIDLGTGVLVKFNQTSEETPMQPEFGSSVNQTPNSIPGSSIPISMINGLELETLPVLRSEHSQFDHVKVWKAPYDGNISIQSTAYLRVQNNCQNSSNTSENNTFKIRIERATAGQISGPTTAYTPQYLTTGSTQKTYNQNISNITKGDLIFFRIHNENYGCGGEVEWNPQISYTNSSSVFYNTNDEHGKSQRIYRSNEDFMMNNGGSWTVPTSVSSVNINFNLPSNTYSANQFSDDIRFKVERIKSQYDSNGAPVSGSPIITTPFTRTYSVNGNISGSSNIVSDATNSSSGTYTYGYRFYVESNSNVQWENINWQPTITMSGSAEVIYPGVSYITFDENVNQNKFWFNANDLITPVNDNTVSGTTKMMTLSHDLFTTDISEFLYDLPPELVFPLKINWVVKQNLGSTVTRLAGKTFYLHRLNCVELLSNNDYCNYVFRMTASTSSTIINPSNISHKPYFEFDLTKQQIQNIKNSNGKLYSSLYIENPNFAINNPSSIQLNLHSSQISNSNYSSFTTKINSRPFFAYNAFFYGIPHRGWGQFLYNGGIKYNYDNEGNIININSPEYFDDLIDMGVFTLDADADYSEPPENASVNDYDLRYTLYQQKNEDNLFFNEAIKSTSTLTARYGFNSNAKLTASLGRFGEPDLYEFYITPQDLQTGGYISLKQRSESKGHAETLNGGIPEYSGSGTISNGNSKVLNQYVDVNGDRYPDLVTGSNIQFTNMDGGMSSSSIIRSNEFVSGSKSSDETYGVNIAGVFPNSTSSDNNGTTRTNINSGLNAGAGRSFDTNQWVDINGDGLSDKITITRTDVLVSLNTGYSFSPFFVWGTGYNNLRTSTRTNQSVGGSFGNASFTLGFGAGQSTAELNAALIDVNGDALPDLVERSSSSQYKFYLNNGKGFDSNASQSFYNGIIDQDYSLTGNLFGSFTFGIPIPLLIVNLKIVFTPTAGLSAGVNEKHRAVQDIDGDGLPDVLIEGANNGQISARLNKVGKTHFLKKVNLPLGGSWTIDYNREGNTYNMPQNQWVLNSIRTNDGFTGDSSFGLNETLTTISYEDPKYDRREREFLGFGTVRVDQKYPGNNLTYRYSLTEYHNENIYLSGLTKRSAMYDASGAILNESTTLYNIMDPDTPTPNFSAGNGDFMQSGLNPSLLDVSRLFVAPIKTVSTTFEDSASLSLEQQFTAYDGFGNLLTYINLGDTYTPESANDAYRTEMEYYTSVGNLNNAKGFVKNIKVRRHGNGELVRQREATYSTYGKLSEVKTKLNNSQNASIKLTYDTYGNLIKSTADNGFYTTIGYDTTIRAYPVSVVGKNASNTIFYSSSSQYDYLFGTPVLITDMNGKQMRTRYDDRGRLVEVTAPNEMPNDWTLWMQYQGESAIPSFSNNNYIVNASQSFAAVAPGTAQPTTKKHHAVTHHHVEDASNDQLLTVSLVDGLGQAIQLKKTLYANSNASNQLRWLISGKETKDAFGRVTFARLPTIQTGYPTTNINNLAPSSSAFSYQTGQNSILPTEMTYDVRDRLLSVKQPGETQVSTNTYAIDEGMFKSTTVNELAQTFTTFTDVRGRQRKTVQNNELTTKFYYNTVGEKIKVKNHQGYETFYKYDLAGRRLEERHPDRGLTTFEYDTRSNLTKRWTSNLLANGQQNPILYQYDDANRLLQIKYPEHIENNVYYTYGLPNNSGAASVNAIGRLYMQQDASGVQGFGYDNLGNLNQNLRGVAVAGRHTFWYFTEWNYDSHNRISRIIYPDLEQVDYNYNLGGTLASVKRVSNPVGGGTADRNIVNSIQYNNLGERTQITYGNGTTTDYTYDNRRRLETLKHQFTGFEVTNGYTFDVLSNITDVNTLVPSNSLPGAQELGGPINHHYVYDNYNRLVEANGSYTGPNDLGTDLLAQEYTLAMTYDLAHNITTKTQTHVQGAVSGIGANMSNPETMLKTNYHLDYGAYATGVNVVPASGGEFGYVQPHAPREIVEVPDIGVIEGDATYKKKLIEYDANGNQLVIKQQLFEGQQPPATEGIIGPEEITLRQNLWDEENRLRAVDLNPEESKAHPLAVYTYDAAGQRVVRYIPGRADVWSNAKNVSSNERDEVVMYPNAMITGKALSKPGTPPQEGDLVSNYTKHYYIGAERVHSAIGTVRDMGLYPPKIGTLFSGLRTKANQSVGTANTGLLDTYTELEQQLSLNGPVFEATITRQYVHDPNKYDAYWYHSDHLGSSSYISNRSGKVSQHVEYLPFGETLVDEHLNSYNTPFKFNGKELDDETGNYYYGARYYDPKLSIWLSVDPLAEKYPNISPYAYVANNPIIYIDPDGREIILSFASTSAMTSYSNLVNSALGGKYQVNLVAIAGTSNYRVEIATLNSKASITKEQKQFYKQLNKVVNSNKTINQEVVENDANTTVDSWVTGKIDIKDVEEFDASGSGAASSAGALTHSHIEQLEKAKKGLGNGDVGKTETDASGNTRYVDYEKSHKKAIKAENKVNGNTRGVNGNENVFKEKDGTKTNQAISPNSSGGINITKTKIP